MIRMIGLILTFAVVLLTSCTGQEAANLVPAGMAQGQPTFLYLFTEN